MRQYKMFQAPVMAFFSPSFYRDVGLHWKGTGFAYLLLLLAICWVPTFVEYHLSVSDYIDNKAPALISQIPPIRIIKGEASVDVTQPYEIVYPDTGVVLAIIDTTGKTVLPEGNQGFVLLTKTEVIFKRNEIETRSFSLRNVEHFTLDQQRVWAWLKLFRNYSAVVFFPFAVIGSFAFRIVQVLLYAVIGLLFAKLCGTSKSYQTLVRLSVMAVTPVIIAKTILQMASVKIPLQGLLFFIAAMAYLFLGVKAVSHSEEVQVGEVYKGPSGPNLNIDI